MWLVRWSECYNKCEDWRVNICSPVSLPSTGVHLSVLGVLSSPARLCQHQAGPVIHTTVSRQTENRGHQHQSVSHPVDIQIGVIWSSQVILANLQVSLTVNRHTTLLSLSVKLIRRIIILIQKGLFLKSFSSSMEFLVSDSLHNIYKSLCLEKESGKFLQDSLFITNINLIDCLAFLTVDNLSLGK